LGWRNAQFLRYLASTTGSSISISITYILFLTKLQKGQTPEKRFALIEKRYHNQLKRCQNSGYIAENTTLLMREISGISDPR
jgi:hypothetical protein